MGLLLVCLGCAPAGAATEGRILKVLPQYLDHQGRASLSPSLYERDAYQAWLRRHPDLRSTMRFEVHWKAKGTGRARMRVRVEIRGSRGDWTQPYVFERAVTPGHWPGRWTALGLSPARYREIGDVLAWRVTLWAGRRRLAEQESFLW